MEERNENDLVPSVPTDNPPSDDGLPAGGISPEVLDFHKRYAKALEAWVANYRHKGQPPPITANEGKLYWVNRAARRKIQKLSKRNHAFDNRHNYK